MASKYLAILRSVYCSFACHIIKHNHLFLFIILIFSFYYEKMLTENETEATN